MVVSRADCPRFIRQLSAQGNLKQAVIGAIAKVKSM
jgi:hypothetical protein